MGPALAQPLQAFVQSILLGMAAGLLYDLLRAFRLKLPRLTAPLDILYCVTVSGAVFLFTLYRAQGQLRLYLCLGALGGCILFFTVFSPLLRPVWGFWVDTLAFLLHLAAVPLRGAENLCKKIGKHGKNLFYFIRKCYTIKSIKQRGQIYKGGRRHGKGRTAAKAAVQRAHSHKALDPGGPGGHRAAAAQPPQSGPGRPGPAGRSDGPGPGPGAGKRRPGGGHRRGRH
ncbi:MAG TPA: spore cortex biosynthesis protein YabQ [Candidatus Oscillibacter excrementavium]|nr:spore cortex biosynthesis protein YabQ [Candidatus Oscillibacter excrementavium]